MSAKTQAKVLRVLQEGEVERLGSARTIKVEVRVIAATNKNLEEQIEKGLFREDLYFRLAVIPVHVPSLRERPEDIPLLVRHYMDYFARENNVRPRRITTAALEALQRYRWKGNIRELRNTVERLMIMSVGETIDVTDLPESVRLPQAASLAPQRASSEGEAAKAGTLREFKDTTERAYLVGKLRENGWNISKTAETIDTPRSNLYKKLRVPVPDFCRKPERDSLRQTPPAPPRPAVYRPGRSKNRRSRVISHSVAQASGSAKAGRKVRTPQGSAPDNVRSGQPEGKWHRKYTAHLRAKAGKGEKVR